MAYNTSVISSTSTNSNAHDSPTVTQSPPKQVIAIKAATQLPLKLTKFNYPSWRIQLQSLLFGYDLQVYIDGTHQCPTPKVTNSDNVTTSNPAYNQWRRQDSLLYHAILASVSDTIIPLIASATSAAEGWSRLEKTFAGKSHTRIMGLRETLSHTTTANLTISEYMQQIKSIAESLALAGSPMSNEELIHSFLQGLGPEFKAIPAAIRARDSLMTFEGLLHGVPILSISSTLLVVPILSSALLILI